MEPLEPSDGQEVDGTAKDQPNHTPDQREYATDCGAVPVDGDASIVPAAPGPGRTDEMSPQELRIQGFDPAGWARRTWDYVAGWGSRHGKLLREVAVAVVAAVVAGAIILGPTFWLNQQAADRAEVLENTRFVRQGAMSNGVDSFPNLPFQGLNLAGANLSGLRLGCVDNGDPCADFRGADLTMAELSSVVLDRARLEGARMSGAQLHGAHLNGANLDGADLTDADLTQADLSTAHLEGANLSGAILTGAIPPADRSYGLCYDADTVWWGSDFVFSLDCSQWV